MPSLTKVQSGFMEAQGALPLSSGTAAAPGLKFDDHAGTGMFSPSTGEIAFSTSSHSQAVTFKTDGKVGIGIANPVLKAHIYNTANADVALIESTQNFATIRFKSATNTSGPTIGIDGAGGLQLDQKDTSKYIAFAIGSERLRIDSSGRLTSTRSTTTAYNAAATTNDSNVVILNSGVAGHATLQFQTLSGGTANTGQATISATSEGASTKNTVLTFGTRQNSDSTVRERLRIASDGRITANGVSVNNAWGGGDDLVLGGTDSGTRTGITLVSGSDTDGGIYWSHGTGQDRFAGQIAYNHNSDMMTFYTDSSPQLRITSAGDMGLGTASPRSITNFGSFAINGAAGSFTDYFLNGTRTGTTAVDSNGFTCEAVGSATPFRVITNGTEKLHIDSSGRIGIGGNGIGSGLGVYLQRPSPATTHFYEASDGTKKMITGVDSTNDYVKIGSLSNHRVGLVASNGERLSILPSGKVGINQVTPTAFMHVKSGANDGTVISTFEGATNNKLDIKFIATGPAINVTAGDPLVFEMAGTERLRITSGGKVGINTTDNTTADLQIRTATNFNGILRIGGNAGTAVGCDITYNNGGATSTIFKQNYRSTNDAALMEFDSGCVAFKTGTGGEERLRIKGNGTIQFTPEGSSTNPNASFDTTGDFFRLNAKKDGSGGCGLVFQTQSNGALSEGMRITDAGIVNTRRHATGNMNAGVAYAPHQYGYIGDYIHYGCNHLFYLATTSTSNTGYSSHMFSWYDSGHWGHYGKLFLFCQEVGYVGGMCHRFLSGTGVTSIFGVGQVSGASTTQTLIGTGTHAGQSVHRYDCTVSHSGTYRSVRWYLGMSNGCILGVTGSGKTQAQADTYASSNGSMLHLFGVSDSNLTMAPNYRTW